MKRRKRKPGYAARIKRQALARKKRLKAGLRDYAGRVVQPIAKKVKRNRKKKTARLKRIKYEVVGQAESIRYHSLMRDESRQSKGRKDVGVPSDWRMKS
jgi:hypothetical protein